MPLRRIRQFVKGGIISDPVELLSNAFHYDAASKSIWWDGVGPVFDIPSTSLFWLVVSSVIVLAGFVFLVAMVRSHWGSFLFPRRVFSYLSAAVVLVGGATVGALRASAQALIDPKSIDTIALSLPVTIPSANSISKLNAAQAAMGEADYGKAVRLLKNAASKDPNNGELQRQLGIAYSRLAETSTFPSLSEHRARRAFERAIKAGPRNPLPIRDLLSLTLNRVDGCAPDTEVASSLVRRLSALDSRMGAEAREALERSQKSAEPIEMRIVCAPASGWRTIHHILK